MKKLSIFALTLLLMVTLVLSLTACGDNGTEEPGNDGTGNEQPGDIQENPCDTEGHEFKVDSKKDATCYKAGSATYVCTVCGFEKTEVLQKTAHKIQKISAQAPTCTTPGREAGERCRTAGCGYTSGGAAIPMLSHNPVVTPSSEPTCVNKGYTSGLHCSTCLVVLNAEDIDAEKYPELAAMAPCEEIPALGHNFVDAGYIAPTCAAEGYEGGTRCSRCSQVGEAPSKIYEKLDVHPEYVLVSDSDCMNDGYSKCPVCGDQKITSYKDPNKHVWIVDEAGIAPDCQTHTDGTTASYKCGVAGCDTIIAATTISWKLLHDDSSEHCIIDWDEENSFAATTEHAGEKFGTCTGCGTEIRIDIPMIDEDSDFNKDNNIYPEDIIGTPTDKDDEE